MFKKRRSLASSNLATVAEELEVRAGPVETAVAVAVVVVVVVVVMVEVVSNLKQPSKPSTF